MLIVEAFDLPEVNYELRRFFLSKTKYFSTRNLRFYFIESYTKQDIEKAIKFSQGIKFLGLVVSIFTPETIFAIDEGTKDFGSDWINLFKDHGIKVISTEYFYYIDPENKAKLKQALESKLNNLLKRHFSLSYKDYELKLRIMVFSNLIIVSLDLTDFDLDKRIYRVFISNRGLKASFAYLHVLKLIKHMYNLLKKENFISDKAILNLFAADGQFSIEYQILKQNILNNYNLEFRRYYYKDIAYFNNKNFSVLVEDLISNNLLINFDFNEEFLDQVNLACVEDIFSKQIFSKDIYAIDSKMSNLRNAEKNARILRIKEIFFRRFDVDWLDYKFGENYFSSCIAYPPLYSVQMHEKYLKFLDETFYQLEYILEPKSIFVLIVKSEVEDYIKSILKENCNFRLLERHHFTFGNSNLTTLVLDLNKRLSEE